MDRLRQDLRHALRTLARMAGRDREMAVRAALPARRATRVDPVDALRAQ